MKKILILINKKLKLEDSGGTESYIDSLKKILEKNNFVEVKSIYQLNENKNYKLLNYFKLIKKMKKIIPYYDIVINSSTINISSKKNKHKVYWIQHSNLNFYLNKYKYLKKNKKTYKKIILFIYCKLDYLIQNGLVKEKNIVLFNKYHRNIKILNKKNIFFAGIPDINYLNQHEVKSGIFYFGRLDNQSKDLILLNNIISNLTEIVEIYGDGPDKFLLNAPNIKFNGYTTNKDLFNKHKIALFTSKFEGCCIAMHEIILKGIIPITTFFSDEVYALIPNKLLDKLVIKERDNISEWNEKIKYINNLSSAEAKNISNQIIEHRKKSYSKTFEAQWVSIVEKNIT